MRYLLVVALGIRAVVLWLLLVGTEQLCAEEFNFLRLLRGVALGLLYAIACTRPELYFLGNRGWYFIFTILIGLCAYGLSRSAVRPVAVFFLVNLVLDTVSASGKDILSAVVSLLALGALYLVSIADRTGQIVPVELEHGGRRLRFMALRDTGNALVDPVTGKPVLVLDPQIAKELTGLTPKQLKHPVESVETLRGLRLVPYNTIGQAGALMLAMRVENVKMGKQKGSALVAFAPESLGGNGNYQALTGG